MSGYLSGFGLECRKIRRTGFAPAFLAGGILASAFPVLNMAVRSEMYTAIRESPVKILLDANWQMMAMMNILLLVAGACLMYHTEYADHAMQKMCMLPIRESSLYLWKALLMAGMCIFTLVIEAAVITGSGIHWFVENDAGSLFAETGKNFLWFFFLLLPAVLVSLGFASACKNMWISLGIGVICVFTATLLPTDSFILSLFPFALPFQVFSDLAGQEIRNYLFAAAVESAVFVFAELLFLKTRRHFT